MRSPRSTGPQAYRSFIVAVVLTVLGITSWQSAVSLVPPVWAPEDARPFQVVRVVDGDTVIVQRHPTGPTERLRYLGIDAPETESGSNPAQDFAAEATEANETLVGDGHVWVAHDATVRDEYDRLLGYVFADGRFVNEELVTQGFAEAMVIAPNLRYADEFVAAQASAREEQRGIWGRVADITHPDELEGAVGGMVRLRGEATYAARRDNGPSVLRLRLAGDSVPVPMDEGDEPLESPAGAPVQTPGGPDGPAVAEVTLLIFEEFHPYFPPGFEGSVRGQTVEVIGRLDRQRGTFQVIVREPGQIQALGYVD